MKTLAAFVVLALLSAVSTVAAVPDSACPMIYNNGAPTPVGRSAAPTSQAVQQKAAPARVEQTAPNRPNTYTPQPNNRPNTYAPQPIINPSIRNGK